MGNCCIRRKYCELECIYPTSPLGDNCVRGLLFILSPFPFCLQSSREGPTTPPWLQIGGRRVVGINVGPHLWTPFSSPSLPSWTDSKSLLGALCVFVGWSWCPDKKHEHLPNTVNAKWLWAPPPTLYVLFTSNFA